MTVRDTKGEFDLTELSAIVSERTGDDDNTRRTIQAAFDVIGEAVGIHGRVELRDIGVFRLVLRAARNGIDPNGTPWETPERHEVEFKASPAFAEKVRAHFPQGGEVI